MAIYKDFSYDELTGSIWKVIGFLEKTVKEADAEGWTNLLVDAETDIDEDCYCGEKTQRAVCRFWIEGTPP
ncbi:MAG: hypothetical protein ACYS7Y_15995 [Planctomycetota bacterium]|jgi:hypothetical protein